MADFSPTVNEGQARGGIPSAAPSADRTPEVVASALAGVANIFARQTTLDTAATVRADAVASDKRSATIVGNFTARQLKLTNAIEEGSIKGSAGRLRIRANLLEAIQANPALAGDFTSAQKTLSNTVGMSAGVSSAIQARQKELNEARSKGWVKEGDTVEQKDTMLSLYRNFQGQLQMLDHQSKILSVENAKLSKESATIGIKKNKLALIEATTKAFAIKSLSTISSAYHPKYRNDIADVIAAVDSGEMTQQQGVLALQAGFATIEQIASGLGTAAGNEYLGNVLDPMKQQKDDAIDLITGKLDKTIYQNSVDMQIARIKSEALNSNPEFATYMAITDLSRHLPIDMIPNYTKVVQGMIIRMTDEAGSNANILDGNAKSDTKLYYETLKSMLPKSDGFESQAKQELQNNVDNVLEAITQFASSTQSAEDFAPTLQFLASPEYGQYSLKNGIPVEKARAAKITLQKVYENSILPAIQKEFSRAGVTFSLQFGEKPPTGGSVTTKLGGGLLARTEVTQAAAGLVEPVFRNGGVQFVPVQGLTGSQLQSATSKAAGLNEKVIPVINQFIRVGAHLEGRTDYQQVFEEQYANIFSPSPENVEAPTVSAKPKGAKLQQDEAGNLWWSMPDGTFQAAG